MKNKNKSTNLSAGRRKFFVTLGWSLLGLVLTGMIWIIGRFLSYSQNDPGLGPVCFSPPEDYPVGTAVTRERVALFRDQKGFWAVTTICPHLGCKPLFESEGRVFVCPCHGSRFDCEGRLLNGPAEKPMALAMLNLDPHGNLVAHPEKTALAGHRFRP
ncbi:MAG: ubiquinol-cytochrome c reductase iron-sulfur subunit [Deltaproteobacteria bacterium]|nr:ubiquinol-cytochrome c reductase iron-sulfur subunit [Deltaproteobacteria bacterium]